ncbi:uncharacterized protein V1518DRAFT_435884 [Limtongia smithiae]|uniref:uncharacterized protein n=1 Tax=Limtongia smithiae TaxID=1125753 RepID=UPI0034CE1AC4
MSSTSVPESINLGKRTPGDDLNITFSLNRTLSSDVDDVLKTQGVLWVIRTAVAYASIELHVHLYTLEDTGVEKFESTQVVGTVAKSEEPRTMDGQEREFSSPVYGPVAGHSGRVTTEQAGAYAPFLARGWASDTAKLDAENGGGLIYATSHGDTTKPNGYDWTSQQVFGFADIEVDEGVFERKYVCRLVFTSPSLKAPLEKRIVFDFVSLDG